MILRHPIFRHKLLWKSEGWASVHSRNVVTRFMVCLLVSMSISGWVDGSVQAGNFGPITDGDVSALINAIESANDEGINPGPDTIILPPNSTYTLSMTTDPRIPFAGEGNNGLPTISSTITIQGNESVIERDASLFTDPEDRCRTLNDDNKFRILHMVRSGNLTLEKVTIQNGCADNSDGSFGTLGGGVFSQGGLMTLTHSTVRDNTARGSAAGGGGIGNYGSNATVTLLHSNVKDNMTTGQGAGIFNLGDKVTLIDSTVSGNIASSGGGGISNIGGPLTLTHSRVSGNMARSGGGIQNDSDLLTLMHSVVNGNTATGFRGLGGGIYLSGGEVPMLTMTHSTVSGNMAVNGGGISATNSGLDAIVTLTHSTVSGNTATGKGGGLFSVPGMVTLVNSTVSGNSATEGGGLYTLAGYGRLTLMLLQSTVSGNTATSNGSGLFFKNQHLRSLKVTLSNTIIADQVAGQDCFDDGFTTFNSTNFNLDSDGTCHLTQGNDKPNGSANLSPLQINSPGTTATHALTANSDALDMGDCSGGTIVDDQRGVSRPQGSHCDIGAFEVMDALVLACDINQDQTVDHTDIGLIFAARNTSATGMDDLRDRDSDKTITVTDGRLCVLECTNSRCMPSVP